VKSPVPVVGLVGYSGSGKTTFLEKLIAVLKGRGYLIGVIKHTHHLVDFDHRGKDTWRHTRAGADVVALASPNGVTLFKKFEAEPAPEEVMVMVMSMFKAVELDLILFEGYKKEKWPKIEVYRRGETQRPVIPAGELIAVVSDTPPVGDAPYYGLDDATGVADLIEKVILKRAK
jgi:molybdopterin-guanine dinucleotide biosynthesis protein B